MIVSNENIDLSGKNITNESGNTIWAGKDIVIEAAKSIHNKISSTIESVETGMGTVVIWKWNAIPTENRRDTKKC